MRFLRAIFLHHLSGALMGGRAADYLALARPSQWVKNGFVFAGLFFAHAWNSPELVRAVMAAFAGFCLISSAVYAFNDIMDREADRAHPRKRERPIAAGRVSIGASARFAAILLILGLAACFFAGPVVLMMAGTYVLLNLFYSVGLKHVAMLDVVLIASGFMLRLLAGTLGVDIEPSRWLLFCGFTLTLFLGFAKRRAELGAVMAKENRADDVSALSTPSLPTRRVLASYSARTLDASIGLCALAAVLAYAWYTLDSRTIELHGTTQLVWSVPFVVFGMGRYLWILYRLERGEDPSAELLRDRPLQLAVLGWIALVGAVLLQAR